MNNFEKEAQQRSVTKAVGRAVNPMEWVRQLSSKKYRELIWAVDRVDEKMRRRVLDLKPTLRDQLHQARMAMKNHEYRRVFQYATSIINSVDGVFVENMGELDEIGRRVYQDFSKDRMSDEEREQLEEDLFREPFHEKVSELKRELVIEAGITQWLQEKLPTKRELEGNLFNKLFQNIKGKQQEAAREALASAERIYTLITEAFSRLDGERRNIMEYVKLAREYHKNLATEKRKLQKRYVDYFPASEPEVQQPETGTPVPQQIPAAQAPAAPQVPAPAPTPPAVVEPPKPETTPDPNDPNQKTAVNELVNRAKLAIFKGEAGVGIALLVKASEICDEMGDEQRSISLLRSAAQLDGFRGHSIDVIYQDDRE